MRREKCPFCLGKPLEYRYVNTAPFCRDRAGWPDEPVPVGRCSDCSSIWSMWAPEPEQLERMYRGYRGREYNALRLRHEPGYDPDSVEASAAYGTRAERVAEYLTPEETAGPYLDWGGDGSLLPTHGQRYAWDPYGADCAPDVIPFEPSHNAPFGAITCLHVLEHVPDMERELLAIRSRLAVDGLLLVEVPMAGNLLGGLWPGRVHEHLQWASPLGMHLMLADLFNVLHEESYQGPLGLCREVLCRAR